MREYRDSGHTVFLSSHILSEVEAVAVSRVEMRFQSEVPLQAMRLVPGVQDVDIRGRTAHVAVAGSMAELFGAVAPYGELTVH